MARSGQAMQATNSPPGFEALEARWMLSANSFATNALDGLPLISSDWFQPASSVSLSAGTTPSSPAAVKVDWKGNVVEARSDQWVIQLSSSVLAGLDSVAKAASFLAAEVPGLEVLRGLGLVGQLLVQAPGVDADTMAGWLAGEADIASFEPNVLIQSQQLPNDPSFGQLWGLNNTGQSGGTVDADIDAPEAWDLTRGSPNVVIAIIDTGVDYTHGDLSANMWHNPGEIAGDGIDNDYNGYVDDVYGWDFVNSDNNPTDDYGHGTHVAGTIGAVGNNSVGVTGVNWTVQMMALKFLDSAGSGSLADAVSAINYATLMKRDHGVNLVALNNSWSGGGYYSSLYSAISAAGAEDILFVAAAGNGGPDGKGDNTDAKPEYPASYNLANIIAVAATDRNDARASFSNYGATTVDLAAPGVSIYSTQPNNAYASMNGTSMATPHVTGVAGLLAAYNPAATAAEIKQAIMDGVDPIASMAGKCVTGGRLNAYGALEALGVPTAPASIAGQSWNDTDNNGVLDTGEAPLAGRTIYLDLNHNGQFESQMLTQGISADVPRTLPDLTPVVSTLTLANLTGSIADVNVTLDISHTYDDDLQAFLIGPSGTRVELFSRVGGSGDNFRNTTFDDQAATAITAGSAPFSGSYRPEGLLSALNGRNPNGLWALEITDVASLDTGTLNSWSIAVTAAEPSAQTDAAGGYQFLNLAPAAYRVAQVLPSGWWATAPASGYQDITLAEGQAASGVNFGSANALPLTLVQAVINGGNAQRSGIRTLAMRLNQDIAAGLDVADLSLWNDTLGSPAALGGATVSYDSQTFTATWNLTAVSLSDARYTATVSAAGLGFAGQGDFTLSLHRLLADINGDAYVDVGDLGMLGSHYGQSGQDIPGDLNFDGTVNVGDLGLLSTNYGNSLPAAPSGLATEAKAAEGGTPAVSAAVAPRTGAEQNWRGFVPAGGGRSSSLGPDLAARAPTAYPLPRALAASAWPARSGATVALRASPAAQTVIGSADARAAQTYGAEGDCLDLLAAPGLPVLLSL